jgi:predicted PolB exonuclease-like 3'-5' exonuclease
MSRGDGWSQRSYLVLDIETVPDTTLYVHPECAGGVERPFPPLYVHRPIVIGVMWLDEQYRFRRLGVIGEGKDERGMLDDFSQFIDKYQPGLVTYNGRGFDLPVLALRALRHGVPMSWYYNGRTRHRYSEEGHLDLCDMLSDHGAARSVSLDAVARLIGLPGKVGVDGSQVEGLWKAGQLDSIKRYCLADVAQTALLFLRFRLLQGALSAQDYRDRAQDLMEQLRADERLGTLMNAVDGELLLGAAA